MTFDSMVTDPIQATNKNTRPCRSPCWDQLLSIRLNLEEHGTRASDPGGDLGAPTFQVLTPLVLGCSRCSAGRFFEAHHENSYPGTPYDAGHSGYL
jgi:hypothetical protein